jgi:hypothetical protein
MLMRGTMHAGYGHTIWTAGALADLTLTIGALGLRRMGRRASVVQSQYQTSVAAAA